MAVNMNIIKNYPIHPEANVQTRDKKTAAAGNFQEILENKIIFSKHAHTRLSSRDLNLSPEQMQRVETGVFKARQKGINESLVIVDDLALVVSVKNKIVITAMERDNESIFTNIDGAVIV